MYTNKTKHMDNKPSINSDIKPVLNVNNYPSIFNKKINNVIVPRPDKFVVNTLGPTKHSPASTREWFNSIYTYNNNSMKDLPNLDKSLGKIIRSYFNASIMPFYTNSTPIPKKRLKTRFKRLSLKNIFVSKAELKHTSDKVIITLYVFDGERDFFIQNFKVLKRMVFTNYKLFRYLGIKKNKELKVNKRIISVNDKSYVVKIMKYISPVLKLKKILPMIYVKTKRIAENRAEEMQNYLSNFIQVRLNIKDFTRVGPKRLEYLKELDKTKLELSLKSKKKKHKFNLDHWDPSELKWVKLMSLLKANKNSNLAQLKPVDFDWFRSHFFKDKSSMFYFKKSILSPKILKSFYDFQNAAGSFLMVKTKKLRSLFRLLSFIMLNKEYLASGDIIKKLTLVKKRMNRELRPYGDSVNSLILNYNKFNTYIFRLTPLISKLYGKEVEFNIIRLKTIFLNSNILTQAISIKLKNRDNRLLHVMRSALALVKMPYINRTREKYGKDNAKFLWINNVKNLMVHTYVEGKNSNDDIGLHLANILPYNTAPTESLNTKLAQLVVRNLKFKKMCGVRLEVKGRLTRRFTASRSVFKVRWIGGLKDSESRYKGITTVTLRNQYKGNVAYSITNSKGRNGAFGVKGWTSGR
jgi:hypothetical protein